MIHPHIISSIIAAPNGLPKPIRLAGMLKGWHCLNHFKGLRSCRAGNKKETSKRGWAFWSLRGEYHTKFWSFWMRLDEFWSFGLGINLLGGFVFVMAFARFETSGTTFWESWRFRFRFRFIIIIIIIIGKMSQMLPTQAPSKLIQVPFSSLVQWHLTPLGRLVEDSKQAAMVWTAQVQNVPEPKPDARSICEQPRGAALTVPVGFQKWMEAWIYWIQSWAFFKWMRLHAYFFESWSF